MQFHIKYKYYIPLLEILKLHIKHVNLKVYKKAHQNPSSALSAFYVKLQPDNFCNKYSRK